jgi:hypothetical protein
VIETMRIGHMIGPPLRKLSIKKFPVRAVSVAGATFAVAAGAALVLAVAGDIAALTGVMPAAGEAAAATGLVIAAAFAGGVPAGLAGAVPGGGWPTEVNTSVTEQRLAISSVFIG